MKIYDVIQNETHALGGGLGSPSVLAWKFTGEDFNDNSQLIVSEAEEAVFIRDGIAVAVFDGGRYTLNSNNHPFIGKLRSMLSGGASAFTSRVYFVNLDHKLELLWGTDSPIQMRDPVLKLQTSIQARGSFSIQVTDSKKFLLKLIGNNIQMFTQEELAGYFRSAFLQNIKDAIAQYVADSGQEILAIATEKGRLAERLTPALAPLLEEYGVRLVNFYIAAIDIPESDPHRAKLEAAFADKGVMGILGEDWGRQQSATILGDLARNPGSGGVAAAGAAAGVGLAAGNVFGEMASQMFTRPVSPPTPTGEPGRSRASRFETTAAPAGTACPACGAASDGSAKFCAACGAKLAADPTPCAVCGGDIAPGSRFCPHCGASSDGTVA